MLKITADRDARRLVLEGSLSGPWVETVDECWRDALTRQEPHEIAVDLTDVTFVDRRGRNLLAAIHGAGAVLTANRGLNAELIHEIAGEERRTVARGRSFRPFLWLLAAVIPSVTLLAACSSVRAGEPPKSDDTFAPADRPPIAVSVSPVVAASLTEAVDVVGSLAPKYAADIKSEVSGTVAAVYVTEWVQVRSGARLARLDTTENDATVEAIRAGEAQARVAETRARREYERALALKGYGLITPQAVDDARSALEAAEASTASARAQVRAAEARLAKSFISAPMDGTIAFRGVNVGDRVENMGGGGPMFRIVDNRLLDLTVSVPSIHLAAVRTGQTLEFTVDAFPGRSFTGKVMFINPGIDEASRAAKVVAEVRNADGLLKGGLFVRGRIVVSNRADVPQVPRAALLNWNVIDAVAEVFVVGGGKVEKRTVQVGQQQGPMVAITEGLAPGEQVVTRGGFALKAGDRVTVAE